MGLNKIKNSLSTVKSEFETSQAKEAEATRQLGLNNNQISQLKTEIQTLKSDATGNAAEIARKEQALANLNSQNINLNNQLEQIREEKQQAEQQINRLNAQVSKLKQAIQDQQVIVACICSYTQHTSAPITTAAISVSEPVLGVGETQTKAQTEAGKACSSIHSSASLNSCSQSN